MAGQLGFGATIVTDAASIVIGNVKKISIPGVAAEVIDITTLSAAGRVANKISGKKDTPDIEVVAVYDDTASIPKITDVGGAAVAWTITFDDFTSSDSTITFSGYISSLSVGELSQDGVIELTYTITITGKATFTLGS